jgi:hypothetical protein
MSADLAVTPILRSNNPFEAARLKLIASLLAMKAPAAYPSFPAPSDHVGVADHMREAAAIFDDWLASVGSEVRDNATTYVSADLFSGSFTAAIDGNETWSLEQQSQFLIDERRSLRKAS